MKEIGILFKEDMVRAILEGRKNQTRRICKPQPTKQWAVEKFCKEGPGSVNASDLTDADIEIDQLLEKSRYGKEGDILYVKETWGETTNVNRIDNWPGRPSKITDSDGDETYSAIIYRADGHWEWCDGDGFSTERSYWKSPLFLRKEDARIWLRNTGVRIERLQDISEEDAVAEGIESFRPVPGDGPTLYKNYQYGTDQFWGGIANIGKLKTFLTPTYSFRTLIQSIHGPEVWEENPFCFVVDFEVLSTTGRPKNI